MQQSPKCVKKPGQALIYGALYLQHKSSKRMILKTVEAIKHLACYSFTHSPVNKSKEKVKTRGGVYSVHLISLFS